MKNSILLIFLLGLLVGCQKKEEVAPAGTLETDAQLVNNLPVDGCEWHLTVGMDQDIKFYLPSEETEHRVEATIKTLPTTGGAITADVRVKYRLTNQKRGVLCGFGRTAEYEAIEVLEIVKK